MAANDADLVTSLSPEKPPSGITKSRTSSRFAKHGLPQLRRGASDGLSSGSLGSPQHAANSPRTSQRLSQFVFWGKVDGQLTDKYVLGETLGHGSFGVVRRAKDITTGGQLCCKTIHKASLSAEQVKELHHETKVMLHLRGHPNIVTIMAIFEDAESMHIAQECCEGGSLAEQLTKRGHLSERAAHRAMLSVLSFLAHCHAMHVLYRDVKPEHFLLVSATDKFSIKAIDFGISMFLRPGQNCTVPAGTPAYWAPEVFDGEYSHPSDLWSAGVMMYQLLCGECPFKGRTEPDLYRSVLAGLPAGFGSDGPLRKVSEPAKDLLRRLLTRQPSKRITAQEAMHHPWFQSNPGSLSRLNFSRQGSLREEAAVHRTAAGRDNSATQRRDGVVLQRLRSYCRMNPLKRAVMHVVVRRLEQDGHLEGMQAMFGGMDTKRTGTLSAAEVMAELQGQGQQVGVAEVEQLFAELDVNHDGGIDATEFLAAAANRSLLEQRDLLEDAFAVFDCDADGCITMPDLCRLRDVDPQVTHLLPVEMAKSIVGEHGIDLPTFTAMMLEEEDPGANASPAWVRAQAEAGRCAIM